VEIITDDPDGIIAKGGEYEIQMIVLENEPHAHERLLDRIFSDHFRETPER
jgi:hypothetical protein